MALPKKPLLEFSKQGIYCPVGGFYIDPWQPVGKAVVTHAHADHSRPGHSAYLAHHASAPVMRLRLGEGIALQTLGYGEKVYMNGVEVSLHPAGHITGSAQVRVAAQGQVWVVSGDYKTEADPTCQSFEAVPCQVFVTESTFGMPIFRWQPQSVVFAEINRWWAENRADGITSVLFAYALGKAQRLLAGIDPSIGPVFVHGAVWNVLQAFDGMDAFGYTIRPVEAGSSPHEVKGSLVVAPPSAFGSPWMRRFQPFSTGMASGWMTVRGMRRRRAVDRGFVLSDHADWPGLLAAVAATGAETVLATHGYSAVFSRYLQAQGLDAQAVETLFAGEGDLDQGL